MAAPTRRRLIVGTIVCLFVGLAGAIVLAWSLALLVQLPSYPRDTIRAFVDADRVWDVAEVHKPGAVEAWWLLVADGPADPHERVASLLAPNFGPGTKPPRLTTDPPSWGTMHNPAPNLPEIGSDTAFGWPMPCLWYGVHSILSQNPQGLWQVDRDTLHGGIFIKGELSSRGRSYQALPLRPIALALTIDTLALATPLWLLVFAVPFLRRRIRRKRGLCPSCGYDLNGDPKTICPECGPAPA